MNDFKNIKFLNFSPISRITDASHPDASIKYLPIWYKKFPKYIDNKKQSTTLKMCASYFDAMSYGYVFVTPCDIEFKYLDGKPIAEVKDEIFKDFIERRDPMDHYPKSDLYEDYHFHWLSYWGVSVPDGYSVLYTSPLNRLDLPFMTTSGIIDNDKISFNGKIPFFIKKGFSGILPKNTPYVQLIPLKREEWVSETDMLSQADISLMYSSDFKRRKKKSSYRSNLWQRKFFK